MNKLTGITAGIIVFLILFYNYDPGLNVSLFALSIWVINYFYRNPKKDSRTFWIFSATVWLSVFSWAWYGDTLSFFALFTSTVLVSIYTRLPSLNLILFPFVFIINLFSFPFRALLTSYWFPKSIFKLSLQKWIATILIPVFFLIIFSFVYATGSDAFENFFKNIFSFNLTKILWMTLLAFIILFNLMVLWVPRFLIRLNTELKDGHPAGSNKSIIPSFQIFDKELENKSGQVTFILLNMLLLLFIILYNYEQFITSSDRMMLSSEIHDRINTILVSIFLAIGLILFYFRAKQETDKSSKKVITLAEIWIALNALLVLSALIKNTEYISGYGLTFKRISVYIFLILCLIGLALSWIKIRQNLTNTYLINRMARVIYFTLIITAPVNFSWIVTQYNTHYIKDTDKNYLQSLDYNKKLLHTLYRDNPEWQEYFTNGQAYLSYEKEKPILSGFLYYKFYLK